VREPPGCVARAWLLHSTIQHTRLAGCNRSRFPFTRGAHKNRYRSTALSIRRVECENRYTLSSSSYNHIDSWFAALFAFDTRI
jgi:hypothetical protein